MTKRRDALKSGFALLGATIGMGTPGKAEMRVPREGAGTELVFHGRQWRISSQDLRRGQFPTAGIQLLAQGEIVDPAGGLKIGDFFSTCYQLNTPGKVAPHEPGSLELHTFIFPDGTLVGTGIASAGLDGAGQFAITGGTGRYHGARGSYVAQQNYADFGGDGTATFTLKLL